jgi:signal transduction histidine kinase
MEESPARNTLGLAATPGPTETQGRDRAPRSDARQGEAEAASASAAAWPREGRTATSSPSRRFFGTRARLIATYLVLLVLAAVATTLAIRAILVVALDERVEDSLQREDDEIDRHVVAGKNPVTGLAFPSLRAMFDSYFAQHVPDNEEAVLTFIDGQLYRSDMEHFPLAEMPASALATWAAFSAGPPSDDLTGEFSTRIGEARYRASHVTLGDETGVFAVAILPAGGLQEIGELQRYGIAVTLGVLLLASLAAWLIVGRSLTPVRQLTETARSISESNLTRRVAVRGSDEAAEMAQSFNRMLDRIEGVFRTQREFVQDASHELRDPLTVCRGQLEMIEEDPDDRHATVALVLDELDRMGRIVDDLQVLAEVEQPDFIRPVEIELEPFTRELFAKASALASRDWTLAQVARGTMVGDRHRLTEATLNLARNAVQHTFPDEPVSIGTVAENGEVRLWVADGGRGILLSDQKRIFDRFTRGRDSGTSRGTGLGLAIVKAIAEAHGGRVEVQSRLGAGSTFTIVLPQTQEGGRWHGS